MFKIKTILSFFLHLGGYIFQILIGYILDTFWIHFGYILDTILYFVEFFKLVYKDFYVEDAFFKY